MGGLKDFHCRVAPDYAADLSVPRLDRCGQNAIRKGDRLLDHVQCTCVDLIIIFILLFTVLHKMLHYLLIYFKISFIISDRDLILTQSAGYFFTEGWIKRDR